MISIGFVIVSTAALILSTIPAFQVRVFDIEVEYALNIPGHGSGDQ